MNRAAILDDVLDRMIAEHAADEVRVVAARKEFEERRGRVFQEEELWERWSAAFVEWFVVERVAPGAHLPPAADSLARARDAGAERDAAAIRAWLTSHRSLFEIRALSPARPERNDEAPAGAARVELLDLLGGALIAVPDPRGMEGVSAGDVVELRVIGFDGDVVFGRTYVFHPRGARDAILAHARRIVATGGDRRAVLDHVAALRVKVERYRHMAPARVYELPTGLGAS